MKLHLTHNQQLHFTLQYLNKNIQDFPIPETASSHLASTSQFPFYIKKVSLNSASTVTVLLGLNIKKSRYAYLLQIRFSNNGNTFVGQELCHE